MSDTAPRPTISLSTPTGFVEVAVHVLSVTPDAITAEFDMASVAHDQMLLNGWFHVGPLTAGPGAGSFGPDTEVRVEVRLDPRLVPGLQLVVATPAAVTELLTALGADSELCSQASWYARAATREVPVDDEMEAALGDAVVGGSLREGYRTAWANDAAPGSLPIVAHLAELLEQRFQGVDPLTDATGFRWTLSGADASWTSTAHVDEDLGLCVLYSVLDTDLTGHDRYALIERTGQLSSGLLFGSWHITDNPLTVRFRSGIELPDRVGTTALLDRLITRHLDIVDEYAGLFD